MRIAHHNVNVIYNGPQIAGVALGADYCAEHEWGFQWKSDFGINDNITRDNIGIPARTMTRCDMVVRSEYVSLDRKNKKKKNLVLLVQPQNYSKYNTDFQDYVSYIFGSLEIKVAPKGEYRGVPYEDLPLAPIRTAWDWDAGFAILAQTEEGEMAIRVIEDAIKAKTLAIGYGINLNPFSPTTLNLIDTRLLPSSAVVETEARDLDKILLKETAEKTGIAERLAAAGKRYYALSPAWFPENDAKVKFWLNPVDQKSNNYGWYTVEELDQWIDGRGPIPK